MTEIKELQTDADVNAFLGIKDELNNDLVELLDALAVIVVKINKLQLRVAEIESKNGGHV